ncbi:MAG TPA: uracil-DNA glycosylase [Rhizomicrobium sp.]|jgi:DNA polymerase|nr:uracil-DNA glycosylase [Rhizomicrobium sp.]
MPSAAETLSTLAWLLEAGADEAVGEAPIDRFRAPAAAAAEPPRASRPATPPVRPAFSPRPAAPAVRKPPGDASDAIGIAIESARAANSLAELKAALEAFEGCALKRSAANTVFADGDPGCGIMLIGESPGRDEDRQGLPFVGRAGQLLDKMLAAIGLDRSKVYITNVLNWRPPQNRDPSPEEAAMCLPFLRRHIELVDPEIIAVLGSVPLRHVMGNSDGILKTRGRWLEYSVSGRMRPVMPTLHPAYLLRQPSHKKLAWRDLQAFERKIAALGLLERPHARG